MEQNQSPIEDKNKYIYYPEIYKKLVINKCINYLKVSPFFLRILVSLHSACMLPH